MNLPPTPPLPSLNEIRELDVLRELSPAIKQRLELGLHPQVAKELAEQQRFKHAAWVLEQVWDFEAAREQYLRARRFVDALRCALATKRPESLSRTLKLIESDPGLSQTEVRALAQWLQDRRRPDEAAQLWSLLNDSSLNLADALQETGDDMAACEALLEAGQAASALDRMEAFDSERRAAAMDALAAEAAWQLGDAEQSAIHAQRALRKGLRSPELLDTLARALTNLSYTVAAETVLGHAIEGQPAAIGPYKATEVLAANYAGVAYAAIDRRQLEEVEVHLLLDEREAATPASQKALAGFAKAARAADALGHPAIRKVIRLEESSGLLVLPRAEGPSLSTLIRSPGLHSTPSRVVAIVLRICDALLEARARGLVHGSLLPSQIVGDAAGRPVLGPFGAHHLAGLTATRTNTLDELLNFTAPELRGSFEPTFAGDVFAVAKLFLALWSGTLRAPPPDSIPPVPKIITQALTEDPKGRPSLEQLYSSLRAIRFDIAAITQDARNQSTRSDPRHEGLIRPQKQAQRAGIPVLCDPSWEDAQIELLCSLSPPHCQTILDRDARTLYLAPWPVGITRPFRGREATDTENIENTENAGDAGDTENTGSPPSLDNFPEALRPALQSRSRARHWVRTPAGEWLLALDEILQSQNLDSSRDQNRGDPS